MKTILALGLLVAAGFSAMAETPVARHLYAALPGVRNYLEYGGHGVLVFAIDQGHRFVKRIPCGGLNAAGQPENVKGICASAETGLLHLSTLTTLQCLDLHTEKFVWEKAYPGGCDRMALSPDGRTMYLPTLTDEEGRAVQSEKLLEIDFQDGAPVTAGNQFGVGRVIVR